VVGTQDSACGQQGGQARNNCAASNEICQNRQCLTMCGPSTCARGRLARRDSFDFLLARKRS